MYRKTIIIANEEINNRLKTYYLDYLNGWGEFISIDDSFLNDDEKFLCNFNNLDRIYEKICAILNRYDVRFLKNITVLFIIQVDFGSEEIRCLNDNWNPIIVYPEGRQRPQSRAGLLGRLILTFPEVKWKFLSEKSAPDFLESIIFTGFPWKSKNEISQGHYYKNRPDNNDLSDKTRFLDIKGNINILFDPTGIRNKIKSILNLGNERNRLAASIDEEEEYAYLHGYIAYKLGYRCFLVTEMDIMEKLFRQSYNPDICFDLTFEDVFINFIDKQVIEDEEARRMHLSNMLQRDKRYDLLTKIKKRIFITVGHKYVSWHHSNQSYYKELKTKAKIINGIVKTIHKPSGGILKTMEQAGLLREYWELIKLKLEKAKPKTGIEDNPGHSAPGRLLLIADKLIERAKLILEDTRSVQDCIHGALLALEAQEILGYKTPTTCLEAIALKHQLEVKAECMFYGIAYNIDMKKRFKEIELEVGAVSRWFHPSVRKKSSLNSQLGILTELIKVLRDFGQFDEEMQCLKRIRKLHRQFYFLNRPWLKFYQPLRAYIETMINSLPLFVGALLFWPTFYGILGALLQGKIGISSVFDHIFTSFYTFFGLQPIQEPQGAVANVITVLIVLTGFLHLGIFISYLYNLIFRK